jgi:hypothetical protein
MVNLGAVPMMALPLHWLAWREKNAKKSCLY